MVNFNFNVSVRKSSQSPKKMLRENMIIGIGNPLLDILSIVDDGFLKKWDLKENDAILCDEKRLCIFEDMIGKYGSCVKYIAGGSTQNTMRTCQWMLKHTLPIVAYMGCIGDDEYGKILNEKAKEAGLNTFYQVKPSIKTGTCAVCIKGHHRSLCANLSAAEKFTIDHVDKHWNLIDNADFYYIAGFFLTSCPDAAVKIAEHAAENNKCFAMNISAPFLVQFFKDKLMAVFPYIDIFFGNDEEMKAFAQSQNLQGKTLEEVAVEISCLPKVNKNRPRMVVITQGKDPVVLAVGDEVKTFTVPLIKSDSIVDTNGAGDAFVGGFLSQYVQDQPLDKCIDAAVWVAQQIIQQSGFSLPETCDF